MAMVADPRTRSKDPPPTRTADYSIPQTAIELGWTPKVVWRRLRESPRNVAGHVTSGVWKGAWQSGTGTWHIPAATVAVVKATLDVPVAVVDLAARVEALEADVAGLRATLLVPSPSYVDGRRRRA